MGAHPLFIDDSDTPYARRSKSRDVLIPIFYLEVSPPATSRRALVALLGKEASVSEKLAILIEEGFAVPYGNTLSADAVFVSFALSLDAYQQSVVTILIGYLVLSELGHPTREIRTNGQD